MAEKSRLAFFEKLQQLSQAMLSAREEGEWDNIERLIAERGNLITHYRESDFPPPSAADRQKIRAICESIQHSDSGILEDATEWRDQIRQFILK